VDVKAHLKRLCEAHGPSGYEAPVRDVVADAWTPLVDSLEVGKLGSLVGTKLGTQSPEAGQPRRRIMLAAHMDEIGMFVTAIRDGWVKVHSLNGLDERTIAGSTVIVHGREPLPGVVGLRPMFTLTGDQAKNYAPFSELFVDLGLPAEEVAEKVQVGDVVTMDVPVIDLKNNRVAGKSFDDRASVAAVTVCLDILKTRQHYWDVLAVATTQEEVGSHGARSEAYRLTPDLAIALDVTFGDQPGIDHGGFKLGEGIPLSLGANFHPVMVEGLNNAAERIELTVHPDPLPAASGTDAWPIQVSRDGIPTALVNLPIRNMHSTVETIEIKDIERAGRLLAEFIAGLEPDFLVTVVWDKEADKA